MTHQPPSRRLSQPSSRPSQRPEPTELVGSGPEGTAEELSVVASVPTPADVASAIGANAAGPTPAHGSTSEIERGL
jgi:hypothetical protein